MVDQFSVTEQLSVLKAQTRALQVLHEAQVLQLKMWPLVLFQKARKSIFRIDFKKRQIIFDVKIDNNKVVKTGKMFIKHSNAPEILDEWVKNLLGFDWVVIINECNLRGSVKKNHIFRGLANINEAMEPIVKSP